MVSFEDLKNMFHSHISHQKKFTKTHLVVHTVILRRLWAQDKLLSRTEKSNKEEFKSKKLAHLVKVINQGRSIQKTNNASSSTKGRKGSVGTV